MKKRKKGVVGITLSRGSLRLSIPRSLFNGKQKFVYLGLSDTPENRKFAELKAHEIQLDILKENFDFSLQKYKTKLVKAECWTLFSLYQEYIEIRRSIVRPGTWRGGYLVMLKHIKRSPFANVDPEDLHTGYAQNLLDWASQELSPDTCRRLMIQLNACLKWAIDSKRVNIIRSPFEGLTAKLRNLRRHQYDEVDINPFTCIERDAIIEAFETRFQDLRYYYYVAFCFYVGCRPSEAIALTWNDISSDLSKITFRDAIVAAPGGKQRCSGLKTQKKRVFPCSTQVQKLLGKMKSTRSPNSELVFTSSKGNIFSINYFRKVWLKILNELEIEYRKPYQTRHTFITLCLEAGANPKDIAKWVGNSSAVIFRHYAGKQVGLVPPKI